jgi:hypothetical protein
MPVDDGVVVEGDRQVYARNLPDKGCVFGIDLPRIQMAAVAPA